MPNRPISYDAKAPFRVDIEELRRVFQEALEQDRDYRLRNEAKLRAASQKTATYEEFKGIVDLAHLQPLKKEDYDKNKKTESTQLPWTPLDKA